MERQEKSSAQDQMAQMRAVSPAANFLHRLKLLISLKAANLAKN